VSEIIERTKIKVSPSGIELMVYRSKSRFYNHYSNMTPSSKLILSEVAKEF
jgi:hypothetical protein